MVDAAGAEGALLAAGVTCGAGAAGFGRGVKPSSGSMLVFGGSLKGMVVGFCGGGGRFVVGGVSMGVGVIEMGKGTSCFTGVAAGMTGAGLGAGVGLAVNGVLATGAGGAIGLGGKIGHGLNGFLGC